MTVGFIPNLHIICPDPEGEVYIPTGKSLVRQLMATGLHAATKRMQLGKETLLQASIVGDQRFIKITADVCKLFMDSGMTYFGNIGYLHPDFAGADGKLVYGDSQKSEKTYLGYLGSNLTNTRKLPIEGDAAESYKAAVYPEGHPQEGQRDPGSEELLVLKKICSIWVPPSTFTGKMRLYIQSLYGSKLEHWGGLRPNAKNQPFSLDYDYTSPTSHETITYHFHPINTGLYLDSNMNHWLVQIGLRAGYAGGDNICITPMKSSACGERLRKKLRKLTPGTPTFDKVEAYILSRSYPVPYELAYPNFVINIPCEVGGKGGIAYGWHFNWSGSQADVIGIESRDLGGEVYDYRSHHHRITISRAASEINPYKYNTELTAAENAQLEYDQEKARWTCTIGEKEVSGWWRNAKWQHVIAAPEWSEGALYIWGSILGGSYGEGMLYCFYTRESDAEPTVVRYSTGGNEVVVEYLQEGGPPAYAGSVGWNTTGYSYIAYNIYGYGGGSYSRKQRSNKPKVTAFKTTGPVISDVTVSTQTYAESARTQSGLTLDEGAAAWYSWSLYVTWSRATFYIPATYTVTTSSTTHMEAEKLVCVIPFGDAEAVYIWGEKHAWGRGTGASDTLTVSSTSVRWGETADNMSPGVPDLSTVVRTESLWEQFVAGNPTTPHDPGYDDYTTIGSKSITNAGVLDFEPGGFIISAFFAGEPNSSVPQQFHTRASAIDGTLWGAGVNVPQGYAKQGHAFIGWA